MIVSQLLHTVTKIIVGVYSGALSDSLQAKSDLSLKKAIELSRQAEARKHNRKNVRENTAASQLLIKLLIMSNRRTQ